MLISWARRQAPREICGFLMQDWSILPGKNVAEVDGEFEIDTDTTLLAYSEHAHEMMGVYHSHPGGRIEPSQADINNAPDGLRYFIVTLSDVVEWVIRDGVATRS